MRITVSFKDGALEEFDTGALTTESAFGRTNALTDLRVTIQGGLWVEASWYRVPQGGEDAQMPLAQRSPGCRLHVLSEDEMEQVRSIELEGHLRWLRVGPDLCDVALLDDMVDLLHDPKGSSECIAGKAVWLHEHLKQRLPEVFGRRGGDERICSMLGMTKASYEYVSGLSASVYSDDSFE